MKRTRIQEGAWAWAEFWASGEGQSAVLKSNRSYTARRSARAIRPSQASAQPEGGRRDVLHRPQLHRVVSGDAHTHRGDQDLRLRRGARPRRGEDGAADVAR